ncbi:lanthionine synthetase C family protein [Streptomyces sp. RFCAC02]|uniref:lanthionine synthetase C family protein n=1 Tax=Streptomyces sp. RFCAC02 TaxID=2499143 RepID=UPI001F0F9AE0|nr:lanthionine synthetase C family protein [Streptomyces sp. RFCAC02]
MALWHVERGDGAAARHHLGLAVSPGVSTGGNASLFHGAPALEFVLGRAGRPHHPGVSEAVDRVVTDRLAAARQRQATGVLPHLAEWDLIRGLTGLGALLLTRDPVPPLLRELLGHLVSLARPVRAGDRKVPGWWAQSGPGGEEMPGGHGNNGIAHGIAGPLALLSLAVRCGVQVPGQLDAIGVMARWLDAYGNWYWTTRDHLTGHAPPEAPPTRPSWCYGRLGNARTQQLAGIALGDPTRCRTAEDAAVRALRDPAVLDRVTDASLCHGWAGLLTVTRSIAADSPEPRRFGSLVTTLHQRLTTDLHRLTKPGLLEGRAGARLALDGTDGTGWTRALLIT